MVRRLYARVVDPGLDTTVLHFFGGLDLLAHDPVHILHIRVGLQQAAAGEGHRAAAPAAPALLNTALGETGCRTALETRIIATGARRAFLISAKRGVFPGPRGAPTSTSTVTKRKR